MIGIPRRYDRADAKRRILAACVHLFLENGYTNTTIAEILREADISSSTFQNIFRAKDGVLVELVEFMFAGQFGVAQQLTAPVLGPACVYAVETAIQLTLTELNENLRDIYIEAYTHKDTLDYIHAHMTHELQRIFASYLPDYTERDFYELEVGSAGIMRSYMAWRCDTQFTLEWKLRRFLEMTLSVYSVPPDERSCIIEFVTGLNIAETARQAMEELFESLAMRFDFSLKQGFARHPEN